MVPGARLDHYPNRPVDDDGEVLIVCACGREFRGVDVQQSANRWGDHDDNHHSPN